MNVEMVTRAGLWDTSWTIAAGVILLLALALVIGYVFAGFCGWLDRDTDIDCTAHVPRTPTDRTVADPRESGR